MALRTRASGSAPVAPSSPACAPCCLGFGLCMRMCQRAAGHSSAFQSVATNGCSHAFASIYAKNGLRAFYASCGPAPAPLRAAHCTALHE
jgi:hypothetical protein